MKKKTLISLVLVAILALGAGLACLFFAKENGMFDPAPNVDPTQAPVSLPIEETKQSIEGQQYGAYFINFSGDRGGRDLVPLSAYTAANYTKQTFFNPYYITKYWEKKDNYSENSLNKYIFPYVSDDIKNDLTEKLADKANIQANFASYTYMPEADKNVLPNCFDSWDVGYCFATADPVITNMVFTQLDNDTMKVSTSFKIDAVFQKNNALEGDSVIETRNYVVDYVMSIKNEPETLDTTLPIMIIESVSVQSLDINVADYLISTEG